MSSIEFRESFRLEMRTYFSMDYLTGAALLARKAFEIETGQSSLSVSEPLRAEHKAFATGAILMSAAKIEAFVNELFAECRDRGARNHMNLRGDQAALLGRIWSDVAAVERATPLEKFETILLLLGLPRLDRSRDPYQSTGLLIDLRKALMHYKLKSREVGLTPGASGEVELLERFEKGLKGRFAENPLTGAGNPFFPDRMLGHGTAEWSVRSAIAFLDDFCQSLSATPPYEHIHPAFTTR